MQFNKIAAAICVALTITACGGGEGDAIGSPPPPNLSSSRVVATGANSIFYSATSNNFISGTSGNDRLVGTSGVDTAVFTGDISEYRITYHSASGTATITDTRSNRDGTDTLLDIEKLQFSFKTFDLINLPRTETPGYGKDASFLFDASYYLLKNPDLVPKFSIATAFESFKSTANQGVAPNAWFDSEYYANKWEDLKSANLDASTLFAHYNLYGVWEGRSAGPLFDHFDGNSYLRSNPDVAKYVDTNINDFLGSRINGAIAHYVIYGANEGRLAHDTAGNLIPAQFTVLASSDPSIPLSPTAPFDDLNSDLNSITTPSATPITFCGYTGGGSRITGTVSKVYDGDTITVAGQSIRLDSIDAPELKQAYGVQSRDSLANLVIGQTVTVTYAKKDKYGRIVGTVFKNDCTQVNLIQVAIGSAWYYEAYKCEISGSMRNSYSNAQNSAKNNRLGLWASTSVSPWIYRNGVDAKIPASCKMMSFLFGKQRLYPQ